MKIQRPPVWRCLLWLRMAGCSQYPGRAAGVRAAACRASHRECSGRSGPPCCCPWNFRTASASQRRESAC